MKRKILFTGLVSICWGICVSYGQQIKITNDSLRAHFRKEEPYKVLEYYDKANKIGIDSKALYYDKELKNYLLKWLDRDQIIKYMVDRERDYYNKFSDDQKQYKAKSYIIGDLKLNYDSIKAIDPSLKSYVDTVISRSVETKRKDLDSKEIIFPPYQVLYLLTEIKYPEVYKQVKTWWYEDGKPAYERNYMTGLFSYMLEMNDPEAQKIFDDYIKEVIKTNGNSISDGFVADVAGSGNAYSVKKLLEILPLRKEVAGIMDSFSTHYVPMDYLTYETLKGIFARNGFDTKLFSSEKYGDATEMRKNHAEIEKEAQKLIKKLEEDEAYWVKNMPYNYIPKIEIKE